MTLRRTLLLAVVTAFAVGCGNGGLPVTGKVNLGGQPLSAGTLALEPAADTGTTGAGAVVIVRDGQFEVPSKRLLTPGTYKVRVSPMPPGSEMDLKTAPPQFKTWETRIELTASDPSLELNVPLQ
jgi:hypothetical protein